MDKSTSFIRYLPAINFYRFFLCALIWTQSLPDIGAAPAAATNQCEPTLFYKRYSDALELFVAKDFEASLRVLNQFLFCKLENPHASLMHLTLGRNYQELGRKDLAVAEFTKSIQLNPSNYKAFANRGLVLASLGKLDQAKADFSAALRLNPASFIALSNRGVASAAQGNFTAALDDFNRSIQINPLYGEAYLNRGIIKEFRGDLSGACADWQRAIQYRQFAARSWVAQQCGG